MKKIKLKKNEVLVLRRNVKGNESYNGFVYPESGIVEALDWEENYECGNGLHGWTLGFEAYYDDMLQGNFVIIKVNKEDGYVELGDKVKFRKGEVILNTPNVKKAHELMLSVYPKMRMHDSIANQGSGSIANQGWNSVANQGGASTANQWSDSVANQGSGSIVNQGSGSTANQGDSSTARQWNESTVNQGWNSVGVCYGSDYTYRGGRLSFCVLFCNGTRYIFDEIKENETVKIVDCKIVKTYTTTPSDIKKLEDYEVFVFGSNLNGNHIGGAAKLAKDEFGAEELVGEGLKGQSYAFPTLDKEMQKVSAEEFKKSIQKLIDCANKNTTNIFLVTKVGCGIAGFTEDKVKEYFTEFKGKLSANIILPWII